jgi:exonuclease VII small subunit
VKKVLTEQQRISKTMRKFFLKKNNIKNHKIPPKPLVDISVKEPKITSFEESLSELKLLLHNKETGKKSSLEQSPTCYEDGELANDITVETPKETKVLKEKVKKVLTEEQRISRINRNVKKNLKKKKIKNQLAAVKTAKQELQLPLPSGSSKAPSVSIKHPKNWAKILNL